MSSTYGSQGFRGPTGSSSGQTMTGASKIPKGYSHASVQQFTPEMMQLFQGLFSNVSPDSFLSRLAGGDQSAFEQAEAPALRQFGQIQGNLASRFGGTGGTGGRRSSGFQNTINQATSDFSKDLQSRRMGMQNDALSQLQNMAAMLLGQRPQENVLVKKTLPFWKQLTAGGVNSFAEGAGKAAAVAAFA